MQDYLIRATAFDGRLRAFAANTTGIVEEMRRRHGTTPVATAALGRTATAGVMMGAMLKGEERLTIQVKGDGSIGQIVVDANAKGEVRGYVDNPRVDLPLNERGKLDVAGAVGEGYLYVIKDLGLKEPYRGSIPIVSGELGEDFTYYFAKSEQTPSAVALGVLVATDYSVQTSGGFILQLLPGMDDEEIAAIEEKLGNLPPITTLLADGADLEHILKGLVESVEVLERSDIRFQCKCSQERVEQTLISLGRDEIEQILREDGKAEVVCHFCNEVYEYNGEQLHNLVERLTNG
ncbi:Hsp33 family molecular chaperone HslO [Paenibacillus mesophilus]|uniref:Hsp33 family molecular chaperone HslO n=1 Tax=Paenibacillus mesophilus TaxID=2582849 RepID=UPI00110DA85F|nr:Hsp33 family molecular chaperone HslO [Paenibacillus mesophilus]TMV44302.1 Hsp33 family molecular chaperone HslO [Paenibacillus mesophilus]